MVKPSSPTTAVSAAMASLQGRRTGIALAKKGDVAITDGMEDPDQLWESAKTPAVNKPAHDDDTSDEDVKEEKSKWRVTKPKPPRFSLNGQEVEEEDTAMKKASHVLSRVREEHSPSELSRVSTAPPTPTSAFAAVTQQHEDEDPLPPPEEDEEEVPYSPPEGVRASPEEEHEEVVVAPLASGDSPTAVVGTLKDVELEGEYKFPDDNEDDMVPPPPPDEDEDLSVRDEEAPATQDEVEFPPHDFYADSDDDGDDDKEGDGFAIVHDPETPDSVRAERLKEEKEQQARKKRAKRVLPKKKETSSVADTKSTKSSKAEEKKSKRVPGRPKEATKEKKKVNVKATKEKKKVNFKMSPLGYPAGNRDYEVIPVSDFKDSPPEDMGVRRSRRARVKPLAFWKNERPLYEAHNETGVLGEAMGHMPVVTGYISANPTPYKKRKVPASKTTNGSKGKKAKGRSPSSAETVYEEDVPFDSRKLRKKFKIIDGEEANMWDEIEDDVTEQKVVAYADVMVATDLPLPSTRKKSEGKIVGKASQAFNVPTDEDDLYVGYIMGSLKLPPGGIKDPESSGACSLSFTVCDAQPKSVELAYGDPNEQDGELNLKTAQRFLIGPGDMFRVMPGNCYRLENHSKTTDCLLSWTIIRPRRNPPPSDDA